MINYIKQLIIKKNTIFQQIKKKIKETNDIMGEKIKIISFVNRPMVKDYIEKLGWIQVNYDDALPNIPESNFDLQYAFSASVFKTISSRNQLISTMIISLNKLLPLTDDGKEQGTVLVDSWADAAGLEDIDHKFQKEIIKKISKLG